MVEKQGIIAGIGDKINGVNLIPPKMDADIYNFIIGREKCLIDGLTLTNSSFTAGTCVCRGYRGTLDRDLALTGSDGLTETNYIYGKFVINGKNDSFSIVGSNVALTSNTLGNDYVTIRNGESGATDRYLYIANAENAEYANVVTGSLLEGVTGYTPQNITDNSKLVATTEFVQNIIKREFNAGQTSVGLDAGNYRIANIVYRRLAHWVTMSIEYLAPQTSWSSAIWNTYSPEIQIPAGYRPSSNKKILIPIYLQNLNGTFTGRLFEYTITPNTNIISSNLKLNYDLNLMPNGSMPTGEIVAGWAVEN